MRLELLVRFFFLSVVLIVHAYTDYSHSITVTDSMYHATTTLKTRARNADVFRALCVFFISLNDVVGLDDGHDDRQS